MCDLNFAPSHVRFVVTALHTTNIMNFLLKRTPGRKHACNTTHSHTRLDTVCECVDFLFKQWASDEKTHTIRIWVGRMWCVLKCSWQRRSSRCVCVWIIKFKPYIQSWKLNFIYKLFIASTCGNLYSFKVSPLTI